MRHVNGINVEWRNSEKISLEVRDFAHQSALTRFQAAEEVEVEKTKWKLSKKKSKNPDHDQE